MLLVGDFCMGGRIGDVARIVKQSRVDHNPLRGAVLGEARQHVVVGIVVDECKRFTVAPSSSSTQVPRR